MTVMTAAGRSTRQWLGSGQSSPRPSPGHPGIAAPALAACSRPAAAGRRGPGRRAPISVSQGRTLGTFGELPPASHSEPLHEGGRRRVDADDQVVALLNDVPAGVANTIANDVGSLPLRPGGFQTDHEPFHVALESGAQPLASEVSGDSDQLGLVQADLTLCHLLFPCRCPFRGVLAVRVLDHSLEPEPVLAEVATWTQDWQQPAPTALLQVLGGWEQLDVGLVGIESSRPSVSSSSRQALGSRKISVQICLLRVEVVGVPIPTIIIRRTTRRCRSSGGVHHEAVAVEGAVHWTLITDASFGRAADDLDLEDQFLGAFRGSGHSSCSIQDEPSTWLQHAESSNAIARKMMSIV
eukprot:CAMPEP_0206500076 /NCGR_PEP_ID=MMETSP0324_2-20121206/52173_1 /ASSEMBLY_ACC=CAM_ASM_000836 /TAXON_ID=2866 /ORGANISM="Crypthecodinium cohnii, Strain Seligo" /LENGTH=352 /DNA_ID=CAMNT_0053986983 /DNA_START=157 /DNA_END=1214 /DNA_ORIENTATION=+